MLAPAIEMADGYPIEAQAADPIERWKDELRKWPESRRTFLVHEGQASKRKRVAPEAGEIFRQPDLAATLRKLVEAEAQALKAGKNRKQAIMAAYDRFYKGDIAQEFARGSQEVGGLHTAEDLANWRVYLEEPVSTNYKGIEVYKLTHWVQGPAMLQTLNILENFDLQVDGLQQRALHPHALPGDESRVRRSRLLLRRFALSAGRADPRPAVERLRARAREADQRGAQRSGRAARRSVSVPGRQQSVQGDARASGTR